MTTTQLAETLEGLAVEADRIADKSGDWGLRDVRLDTERMATTLRALATRLGEEDATARVVVTPASFQMIPTPREFCGAKRWDGHRLVYTCKLPVGHWRTP